MASPALARARLFLELVRFSHTVFALPFALLSALLAWQEVPFHALDLLGILLCMVFARNTAMAFNRLVDRKIDAQNPRTATRHLPRNAIGVAAVAGFAVVNALAFVASTAIFLRSANYWPLALSVPVIGYVCLYSYTKRFTMLAHFFLGSSLMLAPISAWIAIIGMRQLLVPTTLGLMVLSWVAGFDIIYACQDADFDRQKKLFSLPARLGVVASLRLATALHVVTISLLFVLYLTCPLLGFTYLVGATAISMLLIYEHLIIKPSDLSRVNQAFFTINGVVSIGLFIVVALQLAVDRL
jgi:4-hydroxybenzoate polyprenyltransferase